MGDFQQFLDEYGMDEQNPMGQSVSPAQPIQTPQDKIAKYLEELIGRSKEESEAQKERTKLLQNEIETSPRQRAKRINSELIQDKYGFTPDTTAKKIGAGGLNFLTAILGGKTSKQKADELGKQEYEQKTKGYKDLLSQELAAQNLANRAQAVDMATRLKQIGEQNKTDKQKQDLEFKNKQLETNADLKRASLDQGWSGLGLRSELNKAQIAHLEMNDQLTQGKIDKESKLAKDISTLDEEIKKTMPGYSYNTLHKMSADEMKMGMANGTIRPEVAKKFMDIGEDYANFKQQNKGGSTSSTMQGISQLNPETHITTPLTPSITTRQPATGIPYRKKFNPTGELPTETPVEKIQNQINAPVNPVAQVIASQNPKAKQLADQLRQITTTPAEDLAAIEKGPAPLTGNRGELAKRDVDITKWSRLDSTTSQQLSNVARSYKDGSLDKWTGLGSFKSLADFRTAIQGRDDFKALNDIFTAFNEAEHLLARFPRGGLRLQEQFHQAIDGSGPIKNKEDLVRSIYNLKTIVSQAASYAKDPRHIDLETKLQDEYDKQSAKGSVKPGTDYGSNQQKEVDEAINRLKTKGEIVFPNHTNIIRRTINSRNNNSSTNSQTNEEKKKREEWLYKQYNPQED